MSRLETRGPVGWILAAVVMLCGGCAHHEATHTSAGPATRAVASIDLPVAAFGDLVRRDGVLTFRSWDGKLMGMDCDMDLRFLPGGKVEMVEYGLGVMHYQGTYRLDFDGLLTAEFESYGRWPVMRLGSDERSLVLSRSDGRMGMGRWAGRRRGGGEGELLAVSACEEDRGMEGNGGMNRSHAVYKTSRTIFQRMIVDPAWPSSFILP